MSSVDAALLKRWIEHRDAEAFNDLVSRHVSQLNVAKACGVTIYDPRPKRR